MKSAKRKDGTAFCTFFNAKSGVKKEACKYLHNCNILTSDSTVAEDTVRPTNTRAGMPSQPDPQTPSRRDLYED